MIEKKEIESDKVQELMTRLSEIPNSVLSARQFIITYFDRLEQSGKSLKALHHFFQVNGIDVGTYDSFRTVYRRVKRARKNNPAEPVVPQSPESEKMVHAKTDKPKAPEKPQKPLPGLALRPIRLPNGTEIEIDPETGAKLFKI